MAAVIEQSEEERLKTVTSIKFDKEVYDFGTCTEGDKVKKTIEFTNTGKLPLVINQAYGSCGCTVPKYDKEPVLPGKKGKLEIEFNSEHKAGANTKSVMIEANTNPPITTVTFSVKVNASEEKKGWFKKIIHEKLPFFSQIFTHGFCLAFCDDWFYVRCFSSNKIRSIIRACL
jgi:hypothetical protein